jgi:hypothetical protein
MRTNLFFIRETAEARLYANRAGQEKWFPRSVIKRTLKYPAQPGARPIHELELEDWFLEKNPWPPAQRELL